MRILHTTGCEGARPQRRVVRECVSTGCCSLRGDRRDREGVSRRYSTVVTRHSSVLVCSAHTHTHRHTVYTSKKTSLVGPGPLHGLAPTEKLQEAPRERLLLARRAAHRRESPSTKRPIMDYMQGHHTSQPAWPPERPKPVIVFIYVIPCR